MKTNMAVAVLMLSVSLALAGAQDEKTTDSVIQSMIVHHLTQKGLLVQNNMQVSVAGKTITLTGEVPTIAVKNRAEQEARKVEEEYAVVNNLSVKYSAVDDAKLAQAAQNQINRYLFYTVFDWITAEAHDGVVTLKGWVHLPWSSGQIQAQVEKMENVKKVENQIQFVQGSDEVRYRAARVIYTDPNFDWYVFDQNPPIHIIVDGPNVTLEGTVRSDFEKNWAQNLVEFHSDAFHVINHLKAAN